MFTGLIRHVGRLSARAAGRLSVACPELRPTLALGDSVAVNGACLTVAALDAAGFSADLLPDTLRATTLGALPIGTALNLEPALRAGDALGGHLVQGHVDGTLRLLERRELSGGCWRFEFELADCLRPYALEKCSLALDGVSLTLQELTPRSIAVSLIPTTFSGTAFNLLMPGTMVNVEADVIVKTVRASVEQLLAAAPGLSAQRLRELGYGG